MRLKSVIVGVLLMVLLSVVVIFLQRQFNQSIPTNNLNNNPTPTPKTQPQQLKVELFSNSDDLPIQFDHEKLVQLLLETKYLSSLVVVIY